jgi:hypothetical protein
MDHPHPARLRHGNAMRASVTVSMAEDRSGMFSRIDRVTKVLTSACAGSTLDAAGTRQDIIECKSLADLHGISSRQGRLARPYRMADERRKGAEHRRRAR